MKLLQQLGAFILPPRIQVLGIRVLSTFSSAGTGHLLTCTPAASVHVAGAVGGKAPGVDPLTQGLRESTQAGRHPAYQNSENTIIFN